MNKWAEQLDKATYDKEVKWFNDYMEGKYGKPETDTLVVGVVLDSSASMSIIAKSTIDSFNGYVKELGSESPNADIILTMFNGDKTWQDNGFTFNSFPTKHFKPKSDYTLTTKDYIPSGMTPLYDAIGHNLSALNNVKAAKRVLVVITDGQENYSRKETKDSIKKKLDAFKENDGLVLFLGANIDSFAEASLLGISKDTTIQYAATDKGITATMAAALGSTTRYRSGLSAAFTNKERLAAI